MKYVIKNASLTFGTNTILDSINIEIKDGDHIGIVGINGGGKTSLLKGIINPDLFSEGFEDEPFKIQKIKDFTIGYQSQIAFDDETCTLLEELKKSFKDIIDLEKDIEKLGSQLNESSDKSIIEEYTEKLERYNEIGGYTYQKDYEVMLKKFGFKESDKFKKIGSFSGGEKTKIAFIKLLLSKPDILLLDEPTNHLDLLAIEWLEEYLKNYKKAFIVVSHDRMFLNNTVNTIYEVAYGKTTKYSGNYEFYEKKREEDYNRALKDYNMQQKEIKRLNDLYLRFRNKPTKAKMALSKLKMIEKMDIIDKPLKKDEIAFKTNLDKIEESSRRVVTCKNLRFGYDEVLGELNFEIEKKDRIGIIGPNGTGKSTLLKTVYGQIEPKKGSITYGQNVNIGYFDQNLAMEDSNNTVLDEFLYVHPDINKEDARKALGYFLFRNDDVFKKVSDLSGGEKVRLSLCKILYNKPNFLILDEPTNHMDISNKKHLEETLKMYKGTILFVSHDRYFVKNIADKLIVFEDGNVNIYNCNYDEYMRKKKFKEADKVEKITVKEKTVNKVGGNTFSSKKELVKLENKIIKTENEIKLLNEKLLDPNIYCDYELANNIDNDLKKLNKELEILNDEWNALVDSLHSNA